MRAAVGWLSLLLLARSAAADPPLPATERAWRELLAQTARLDWLATPPRPGERALQFSSFDRRSLKGRGSPDDWFANGDAGNVLRTEPGPSGTEHVLAEARGPGVVTRIWSANPAGELRFYVDEDGQPAWTVSFADLLSGAQRPFVAPLACVTGSGFTCHPMLPFAKSLKLTCTRGDFYYHVNVRTFPPSVRLPSLSAAWLATAAPALEQAAAALRDPPGPVGQERRDEDLLAPGARLVRALAGKGTVTALEVSLPEPRGPPATETLLRSLLLRIAADDPRRPDVLCPLGDFFGAGPGASPYAALPARVRTDGTLVSRLPMPFSDGLLLTITNEGLEPVRLVTRLVVAPEPVGPLRLHATWRGARDVPTQPPSDWTALEADGPGRFVGLALSVRNPVRDWWGEGDEKVWVDGEPFPSTFGTGTEDYFGFAWCSPETFEHPYRAQPRCDGPMSFGHTSAVRFQVPDMIPFQRSLRFDLEVLHWAATRLDLATTAWWYGPAGADAPDVPPAEQRLARPLPSALVERTAGAIEGETLSVLERTAGLVTAQDMQAFGPGWSSEAQLWWRGARPGDRIVLRFAARVAGPQRLLARFTHAPDYAVVALTLDGRSLVTALDLYAPGVGGSGEVDLGLHDLVVGEHRLGIEIRGANAAAQPGTMVGLDYLRLEPGSPR